MSTYIELRLYEDGHIERHEIDEEQAYGWIDNPGYCYDNRKKIGYDFVVDTPAKVNKKFKKMVSNEFKLAKEKYEQAKRTMKSLEEQLRQLEDM